VRVSGLLSLVHTTMVSFSMPASFDGIGYLAALVVEFGEHVLVVGAALVLKLRTWHGRRVRLGEGDVEEEGLRLFGGLLDIGDGFSVMVWFDGRP
jgi:hypothetical protein